MSGKRATIDKNSKKREELRMKLEEENVVFKDASAKLDTFLDTSTANFASNKLLSQSLVEISTKLNDTALGTCLLIVGKLQGDIVELQSKLSDVMTQKVKNPFKDHRTLVKESIKKKDPSAEDNIKSKTALAEQLCEYVEEFRDFFTKGAELLRISAESIGPLKQRAKSEAEAATASPSADVPASTDLRTSDPGDAPPTTPNPEAGKKGKGAVFGRPLSALISEASPIPAILVMAAKYLDGPALDTVGLFRIAGAASKVAAVREEVDSGKDIDFSAVPSPHIVCTIVKQWLKSLPEPLIVPSMFELFLNIVKEVIEGKQTGHLKQLVQQLPKDRAIVLDYICALCRRIAAKAEVNKMTLKNLASLIAPNVLYSKGASTTLLEDMSFSNQVVSLLLERYDEIFAAIKYEQKPAPIVVTDVAFTANSDSGATPGEARIIVDPVPAEDIALALGGAYNVVADGASEALTSPNTRRRVKREPSKEKGERGDSGAGESREHRSRRDKDRRHREKRHKRSSSDPDAHALSVAATSPASKDPNEVSSPSHSEVTTPDSVSPALSRESSVNEKTSAPPTPSNSGSIKHSPSNETVSSSSKTRLFPKSVSPLLDNNGGSGGGSTEASPIRGFRKQSERRSSLNASSDGVGGVDVPAPSEKSEKVIRRRSSSIAEGQSRARDAYTKSLKTRTTALSTLQFENPEEFDLMMDDTFGNATVKSGWVLLGYSKPNTLKLQTCGDGGVAEVVQKLNDTEVQYILVRMGLAGKATRDVFIQWTGSKVSAIQKGIKKGHLGEVKAILQPFHAELQASSKESFTETVVLDRSNPLSGSHVID